MGLFDYVNRRMENKAPLEVAIILGMRGTYTPAALHKSICAELDNVCLGLSSEWKMFCRGKDRRSWVGINSAARKLLEIPHETGNMHGLSDFTIESITDSVWGVTQLFYNRDYKHCENEWEDFDICKCCWRLAPKGALPDGQPAFCDLHNPRPQNRKGEKWSNKEYQSHRRFLKYLPETLSRIKKHIPSKQFINSSLSVFELNPNIFPQLSTHIASNNLPQINLKETLLCLLLDVPDIPEKDNIDQIKGHIDALIGSQEEILTKIKIYSILVHAEAWLEIKSTNRRGGKRKGAGRPPLK